MGLILPIGKKQKRPYACCNIKENMVVYTNGEKCKVCGRRHFIFKVEPLHFMIGGQNVS